MRRQSCCMNGARQREEDAVDHTKPWLRYVSTSSVSDATLELDDMKVCNETGEDLGTVDGFVVDSESGRPRYVVVDAGGWFTSKQFLVPIGQARLVATRDALRVPLGKDQIGRFPGFDLNEFATLTDADIERLNRQHDMLPAAPAAFDVPEWWMGSPTEPTEEKRPQADGAER